MCAVLVETDQDLHPTGVCHVACCMLPGTRYQVCCKVIFYNSYFGGSAVGSAPLTTLYDCNTRDDVTIYCSGWCENACRCSGMKRQAVGGRVFRRGHSARLLAIGSNSRTFSNSDSAQNIFTYCWGTLLPRYRYSSSYYSRLYLVLVRYWCADSEYSKYKIPGW